MEDTEGPFLLMTPPEPLNEKYPDHRIKRWEMFLMAKGLFFDKTEMPEGMEEHDLYDKPIDGWLGTMYQRGEATRRRKDNGQIELFGDQEIAKRLFTKNSDNQSTN